MPLPTNCSICEVKLTRKNRASVVYRAADMADLCVDDYEAAGLENEHQDGHHAQGGEFGPQDGCPMCNADADEAARPTLVATPVPEASGVEGAVRPGSMESGKAKARKLLADAVALGWALKEFIEDIPRERFELRLWNESTGETIDIAWNAGVLDPFVPYRHAGREVKLKNASAARKRMGQEPDVVMPRRTRSTDTDETGGKSRIFTKSVPFDPEHASEAEILAAVAGRKLIWINTISGLPEEAVVRGKKHLSIVSGQAGRPILQFVDTVETGFRAVALEALLQVV